MTHSSTLGLFIAAALAFGCAVETDEPAQEVSGASHSESMPRAPACERIDELGIAGQGECDKRYAPEAVDSVCVAFEAGALTAVAGRRCQLVDPQSLSFSGCSDWYVCEGCYVVLRRDLKRGTWTLEGQSGEPECQGLHARYALTPGEVCSGD